MSDLPISASAPAIFSFDSTRTLRVLSVDGEPWFVAADVCGMLDISNSRDAISRLDDDEKGVALTDTLGGQQEMNIISESGFYALILRCRDATNPGTLPHRVRKWVTSEVLPSIRKTGRYEATAAQPSIQAHFQGSRWLVHMDQRGNLIFNPVDCEAFHVPAREFPAVIGSEEFPGRLLPEVLSAVSERMRRTGGLLQGDVRSEPRPPVLSAAPRLSALPETNRPAQPQASRSRRPVTQRTTPHPARREYPPPFTMKRDFVEVMLEMVQEQKAKELAAKLRIDSRCCHQVIVYVEGKSRVTTAEVVAELHEEGTDQNKRRAGRILKALGFFGRRAYQGGKSFRVYVRGGQS